MKLIRAVRADHPAAIALVGAGGKTTALFLLARQFERRIFVTTSTHLAVEQVSLADQHIVLTESQLPSDFQNQLHSNVILLTGPPGKDNRVHGLTLEQLQALHEFAQREQIGLLVEADGSRRLPLKAPAEHEPVIPPWVDCVIVSAGMQALGKPLTSEHVHRPEIFARISAAAIGESVSTDSVATVLKSPAGGLKNIPKHARKIALLNQADSYELQVQAQTMAASLHPAYNSVLVASLQNATTEVVSVHEPAAGIILAAGGSARFGQPKILLDWHGIPFIRKEAETALAAGLSPVIVVLGAVVEPAVTALQGLPVQIVVNEHWQSGQSLSVRTGVAALPVSSGSAIFLLGDQPQVTSEVLNSLLAAHERSLAPIIAPKVAERRVNPVLFDRVTFSALQLLEGDTGGRSLFTDFPVQFIDWHDERLALDVDTLTDYQNLLETSPHD
jgi:molybdenum cofactor cytidylyltransferase